MNMNYATDPVEVESLVVAIKAFFNNAAAEQHLDVGAAVELLTATVHLVDPNYTPPEPAEMEA